MSLYSMTGYGVSRRKIDKTEVKVEMRSVNSRFLEINMPMPRKLRPYEIDLQNLLKKKLNRGKVEVRISMEEPFSQGKDFEIDYGMIDALKELIASGKLPLEEKFTLRDLLALEGAVVLKDKAEADYEEPLKEGFLQALDNLLLSREREGEALKNHMTRLLYELESHLKLIREKMPLWKKTYSENFRNRLMELLEDKSLIQEERLEFELALFSEKKDIEEEIQRALTHVEAFKRDLDQAGPHGRKLDFLVQELLREINTMGSKSAAYDLTKEVIEAKTVLEQIREQLQNVE